MTDDLAVGFDFGTSNSAIAVVQRGEAHPHLLRLDSARPDASLVPSTLYFRADGTLHIGYDAIETFMRLEAGRIIRREMRTNGQEIETVFGLERVIQAVDVDQPGRFFQSLKRSLGDAAFHRTDVFGTSLTLEELIAAFASLMRRRAETAVGAPVTDAVVGRPVHWADSRAGDELARRRMEVGLRLAGFERFRFLEEPIAAGLRLAATLTAPQTVLVFDFGGGTLDVTVMRVGGGEHTVLSTAGRAVGGTLL